MTERTRDRHNEQHKGFSRVRSTESDQPGLNTTSLGRRLNKWYLTSGLSDDVYSGTVDVALDAWVKTLERTKALPLGAMVISHNLCVGYAEK